MTNSTNAKPLHDEIARRAYELFEQRGRKDGYDLQDWFQAESELREYQRLWKVEAPKVSLTDDIDTATLVLRLGIAVNAIRASQRFYLAVENAPGLAGERDQFWAFLIALGFLREAIVTVLVPKFPMVKELAKAGGAQDELIKKAGELLSGKLPLTKTLDRMRNKLIFHWDEEPIRDFITSYTNEVVVWGNGIGPTQGEMIHSVAVEAVTKFLLPDEPDAPQPEPSERTIERLNSLISDVLSAMRSIEQFFEFAIIGYMKRTGAQVIFL